MPSETDQPEIALLVNGAEHKGWKTVSVRTGIEEFCPSFNVGFAAKWSQDSKRMPIRRGDEVEVKIVGGLSRLDKTLLTGYVDANAGDYDGKENSLSVQGRAKTCDIYDCSAIYKSGQIKGKTLLQIAELLCAPFGVSVEVADPALLLDARFTAPVEGFRIQIGETVFEALTRLAKKRGVLLVTTTAGKLAFTRASQVPLSSVEVKRGENVLRGGFQDSFAERFSEYHFKGQTSATDEWSGAAAALIGNVVKDENVKRYRPLVILAEHQGTREDLGRRAIWERNTRAGRGLRLNYTVRGWTHIAGIWEPNTLVRAYDDWFEIDDAMLITGVDFVRTKKDGRVSHLELTGPEAYDVLEAPKGPTGGTSVKFHPLFGSQENFVEL